MGNGKYSQLILTRYFRFVSSQEFMMTKFSYLNEDKAEWISMNHQQEDDRLLSLARFCEELIRIKDSDQFFEFIVHQTSAILDCPQASLMLFDPEQQRIKKIWATGFDAAKFPLPRVELTDAVDRWLFHGGEVLALTEAGKANFHIVFDQDERSYFDCELRIPIFFHETLFGILNLGQKSHGNRYSDHDINLLRVLINIINFAVERMNGHVAADPSGCRTGNPAFERCEGPQVKIKRRSEGDEMIGCSESLQRVRQLIDRVAASDVPVLITGESGTGKELVARAIHQRSSRAGKPLVAINCASLPENLVESELFGYEKGAFTGANRTRQGKFEYADGGTLFLDEIGDMSHSAQARLLRVLQDKTLQRLGSNSSITVDVRIITATNKNLVEEIERGHFREDLYYRIHVVEIHVPALRERPEDIPVLAEFFLKKYSEFYGKGIYRIAPKALQRLMAYSFPGNVRELQNMIERAVIMEQGKELSLDFLDTGALPWVGKRQSPNQCASLEELERAHIQRVMEQVNYNKSQAARILGIARKTLREKMQKYSLCSD